MRNGFIGQHGSRQVAHDLMHFDQDLPGVLLVESNRFDMRTNFAPLLCPVVRRVGARRRAGIGTLYRHFPERSDLVAPVFRHQIDACANAANDLATKHGRGEALARWLQRYAAFVGTKRGLAKALHSGNPAFDILPANFNQRLEPALRGLLESAVAAGEIRTDVAAESFLGAVAGLCMQAYNNGPGECQSDGRPAR
jgi:AcrR family transcriptional regulator